jgi:hypothetical protein
MCICWCFPLFLWVTKVLEGESYLGNILAFAWNVMKKATECVRIVDSMTDV